jgi:hypothetical protein
MTAKKNELHDKDAFGSSYPLVTSSVKESVLDPSLLYLFPQDDSL